MIGKLETLKGDTSLLLTSLGLKPETILGHSEEFNVNNEVNILLDVARRTFEMIEDKVFEYRKCLGKPRMLSRTWSTFQVHLVYQNDLFNTSDHGYFQKQISLATIANKNLQLA